MKKIALGVILFNLALFFLAFITASWFLSPISPQEKAVTVVIPKGAAISTIGNLLEEKGLIRSAWAFRFVVWKNRIDQSIQAGTFTLSPSDTPEEIALALTRGTNDVWVTLLEGWRSEEMADEFEKTLGEGFDKAAFIKLAKPQEGYLFPDTYLFPREATAGAVVRLLRQTFDRKVTDDMRAEIARQGRSLKDVVILASILEREARSVAAKKIVAGILLRRLVSDWPLQADATLQYIKGYDAKEKTWWPTPLAEDKKLKSPYNTYMNKGLPPAPISNPGLVAIQAVISPQQSSYWFYISDLEGGMHYTETLEEHNANVQKYLR